MFQERINTGLKSLKLSKKECNYIVVLKQVTEGILSRSAAAVKLNISKRHIRKTYSPLSST